MAENNEENRSKLASEVVDRMDLKDLLRAEAERIESEYEKDDDLFQQDWQAFMEGK